MKTIEELYKSILADTDLRAQCSEAIKNGKLDDFLKEQGCSATVEDVKAFFENQKEGKLDDEELDTVSGGCNGLEALISVATLGVGCGVIAAQSAGDESGSGAKKWNEAMGEGAILCPMD